MARDIPPWPALEAFMAAARCDSFKQAADALGLSAPAFTRRIQTLEHRLGVRLFDRDAQRATLTPAGRTYLDLLRPGFDSLRQATAAMSPDRQSRPLRLRISHSLATIWLVPRLPRFCARYPEIELQLQSRGAPEQLADGSIDVGIFFSRTPLEGLALRKLFALEAAVVAAPALHSTLSSFPDDLARHPLLDLTDPGEIWPEWLRAAGACEARPAKILFDSLQVMYQAAAAGVGVALGVRPIVDPFLADGRLCVAFAQRHDMAGAYYVAATRQTLQHAAARKLWQWIGEEGVTLSGSAA